MKRWFLIISANIVILLSVIALVEVAGQSIYYLKHKRFTFEPAPNLENYYRLYEVHPFLVSRLKKSAVVEFGGKDINITGSNTRWTGAREDDNGVIRVAVLGGLTTFGTGVRDQDTWPALLQQKLGPEYSVINYGVPGYSTAEAIIQMGLIVPESQPDIVIMLQGWNDIRNYHKPDLGADYYAHGVERTYRLTKPAYNRDNIFDAVYDMSIIGRLASKVKIKIAKNKEPCPKYEIPDPFVDRIYARNLNTLKLLSGQIAEYTIFVPQVLNYKKYEEMEEHDGCNRWTTFIKNSAVPELMDRFNLIMESVCSENDNECIYLASVSEQTWNSEDFVDSSHFSRKGGEKLADIIADTIKSNLPSGNGD